MNIVNKSNNNNNNKNNNNNNSYDNNNFHLEPAVSCCEASA